MAVYKLTVSDILKIKGSAIMSIRPDKSAADAARVMKEKRIGILMVAEEGGKVIGVLSERDIVGAVAKYGEAGANRSVREIMTRRMVVCRPYDDAKAVMKTMQDGRFRHMPVMHDGEFVGLISIGDILHHLLEQDRLEEEQAILSHL